MSNDTAGERHTLIRSHPGFVLTVGYLLISVLGLSFNWALFQHFDVNIFNYAEVSDFLMGALREPMTFVLAGTALGVAWLAIGLRTLEERWFAAHPPKTALGRAYVRYTNATWSGWVPSAFFVGYSVLFIYVFAEKQAAEIMAGNGREVTYRLAGDDGRGRPGQAVLLGATTRFLLLYDPDVRTTTVVPHENLAFVQVGHDAPAADATTAPVAAPAPTPPKP